MEQNRKGQKGKEDEIEDHKYNGTRGGIQGDLEKSEMFTSLGKTIKKPCFKVFDGMYSIVLY